MAQGFLVAVQPVTTSLSFSSRDQYKKFVRAQLDKMKESIPSSKSKLPKIAVFPETIGAWLIVSEESSEVYSAQNTTAAMIKVIMSHLFLFLSTLLSLLLKEWKKFGFMRVVKRTVFKMNSKKAFEIYVDTYSQAAKDYQCYIIAGSVFLPKLTLKDGNVSLTDEGLYNVALSFNPKGEVCNITYKCFPIPEEDFIDRGDPLQLQTFPTELGNVGVLICADSWVPDLYQRLKQQNVDLIAVPTFVSPKETWSAAWKGYTIEVTPSDVDQKDINTQTEKDMWIKYSLRGRYKSAGAVGGIHSFCHGQFWGMSGAGQSYAFHHDSIVQSNNPSNSEEVIILEVH